MATHLLCRTCGEPAAHVHFIPWIEEPERVELACARHEPGGDDGEWYTLAELEAEPEGFLRAVKRSSAPAPPEITAWLGSLGSRPKAAAEPAPRPVEPGGPLTVKQAAEREGVGDKTIRRRLPELQASGGAWQIGTKWLIDPAALDRLRVEGQKPQRRPQRARPTAVDVKGKPKASAPSRAWKRP